MKELRVKVSGLAMDGESEAVTPAVGDPVSVQVDGTVSRVDGGWAVVMPTAINGEPVESGSMMDDDEAGEPSIEEEGEALRRELEGMA